MAGALSSVSWSLVFVIDAVTSFVAATVLWRALRELPAPSSSQEKASIAEMLRGPLRDGLFMLIVLVGFMTAVMFMQCSVALAAEMRHDGLVEEYGPILAINGVLIGILQPSVTQVTARFRSTVVLGVGSALVGLGFFSTMFADAVVEHAGSIAVWTLGEILLASTMPTVITRLAPANRRATYQGLYQLSWSAAAFAPAAGAFVLEHLGAPVLWSACLAMGLLGALVQGRIDRSPRMHDSSSS